MDTLTCLEESMWGLGVGGGGGGGGLALSQLCLKHFGSSPSAAPVRLTTVPLSRHQRWEVTAGVASMSVR